MDSKGSIKNCSKSTAGGFYEVEMISCSCFPEKTSHGYSLNAYIGVACLVTTRTIMIASKHAR